MTRIKFLKLIGISIGSLLIGFGAFFHIEKRVISWSPLPCSDSLITWYSASSGVEVKAMIVCNGSGKEIRTYWGEMGEDSVRKLLKDTINYTKQ